ncbi:hypothetical protein TCT1_12140 [Xenorhabdus sp. TCT-1]|uniref:Uncharacterized protein n=1 Tax=Xenorhabdus taiwanensis TaxID=3085177 RepID=A0ABM8JY84_9GAMM|nr:hypothetical protein TCT1_12140 [Xenorhabdus sp. TCT-1]
MLFEVITCCDKYINPLKIPSAFAGINKKHKNKIRFLFPDANFFILPLYSNISAISKFIFSPKTIFYITSGDFMD